MKYDPRLSLAVMVAALMAAIAVQAQPLGVIQGKVVDDTTSMPLANANIVLEGTRRGTTSNGSGRFTLRNIPPGAYLLRIKYIGYAEVRHPIRLPAGDTVQIDIRLKRVMLLMPEIGVTASRQSYDEQSLRTQPSVIQVSPRQIQRVPTVGEPDLFRAVQTLPGITAPSQASNQLYIRGGSPDQNLVRIDGAVVYNPFHLFGLAANFNPDLLEKATVSTGGFPARYGDRLSGVVDVETRHVDEPFIALGNFSLLSSKLMLAGRLGSRLQWIISGRRSYHDWAAKLFRYNLPYHFYDLFGKTTWVPNARYIVSLSVFYSADILYRTETYPFSIVYELDEQNQLVIPPHELGWVYAHKRVGFPWNNLATSLRWEYALSSQWATRVTACLSRMRNDGFEEYDYFGGPGVPQKDVDALRDANRDIYWSVSNTLQEFSVHAILLWQPAAIWQVYAGVELSRARLDYYWDEFEEGDNDVVVFFDGAPDSFSYRANYNRHSVFVEGMWQLAPRLRLQPSWRWDYRTTTRIYTFDPRLSATFELKPNLFMQAAVGRYHQGLAFLREGGIFGVNELYFPMSFNSAATHGIVGFEYKPKPDSEVKLEAYYKNFDRQAVPIGSAPHVGKADGWAYGLEITFRHRNSQAFYVFSRVRRRFDHLTYDTPWDVRHRFQLASQIDLGKSWDFNLQWELRTGQPYSPRNLEQLAPIVHYNPRTGRPHYGYEEHDLDYPKGAIRYPIYHRLDVTFAKRLAVGKWSMAPYFQIINLYNRKNPLFYEEDYLYTGNASSGAYKKLLKPVGVPPLPSLGVRFAF